MTNNYIGHTKRISQEPIKPRMKPSIDSKTNNYIGHRKNVPPISKQIRPETKTKESTYLITVPGDYVEAVYNFFDNYELGWDVKLNQFCSMTEEQAWQALRIADGYNDFYDMKVISIYELKMEELKHDE